MITHLGTEFFSHVFFFNLDFEFQYDLSGCYYIERRASIASGIIVDSSLLLSKGHDTFAIAIISTMNKSVWYSKIAIVEMKDSFKVVLLSYLNGVLEKTGLFCEWQISDSVFLLSISWMVCPFQCSLEVILEQWVWLLYFHVRTLCYKNFNSFLQT